MPRRTRSDPGGGDSKLPGYLAPTASSRTRQAETGTSCADSEPRDDTVVNPSIIMSKPKRRASSFRQQRAQASAGIRRRWQKGADSMKSKKKYIPLKSTPPRRPAFDINIDDDDIDEDLNTTATASDLSLSMSMSSPDRSMNTSSLTPALPAPAPAPVQSASASATSANSRRIERAAAALDAAGHKHLEGGRVGDALEAYRRALKLKRRLLKDADVDAAGMGGSGMSPIAQGEEAMLRTTAAAPTSTANDNDSNRQGGDNAARDPHREALLASVATCLLYTSPSPRDAHESRMPSSA